MRMPVGVDASLEMGSGHVMRFLAHADELKRYGHKCAFTLRRQIGESTELIKQGLHAIYILIKHALTRCQDLEEAWHDVGQFYWGKAEAGREGQAFFTPANMGISIPRYRAQDIDTEEDWINAERLFSLNERDQ